MPLGLWTPIKPIFVNLVDEKEQTFDPLPKAPLSQPPKQAPGGWRGEYFTYIFI